MSHGSAGARFTRLVVPACLSHRPPQPAVGLPLLHGPSSTSNGAALQAASRLPPPQCAPGSCPGSFSSSTARDSTLVVGAHRRLATGPVGALPPPALLAAAPHSPSPSPSVHPLACPSVCPRGTPELGGPLGQSLSLGCRPQSRTRSGEGLGADSQNGDDPTPSASSSGVESALEGAAPAAAALVEGVPAVTSAAAPAVTSAEAPGAEEPRLEQQPAVEKQPLDPSRPWLVHPRRTKAPPVAAQARDAPRAAGGAPEGSPELRESVPNASAASSIPGEDGEKSRSSNGGFAGADTTGGEFNGYFPHKNEFQVGPEAVLKSQEVLALLGPFMAPERRQRMHAVVENRTVAVVPVVEGLSDLGNVSAVCRTSDGLGFQNVHVVHNEGGKARLFRNNRRVSMGSDKWLDVETWGTTRECLGELKRRGYRIAVTCLAPNAVPIYDIDWTIPTAVVFGNEHRGVTEECVAMADVLCCIPMLGMVESFNISVATAVILHHVTRDRTARKGRHGDLSEEQKEALLAHYALRHRGEQSQSLIEHLVHTEVEKARAAPALSSPGALKGVQRRMREILRKEAAVGGAPRDEER